jgi:hypothetical protein
MFHCLQMDGSSETFTQPATLQSKSTVRCPLPTDPLQYISSTLNYTSIHGQGFDFNCLYPGSPVITYLITVSNDGVNFGSGQQLRIVDTLCYGCNGSNCRQLVSCMLKLRNILTLFHTEDYCSRYGRLNRKMNDC